MPELHPFVQLIGVVLASGGASWFGIRASLNGTRENVRDLKDDVRTLSENMTDVRERLARMEGKR